MFIQVHFHAGGLQSKAPGFIDTEQHGLGPWGIKVNLRDGVTTQMDFEIGALNIDDSILKPDKGKVKKLNSQSSIILSTKEDKNELAGLQKKDEEGMFARESLNLAELFTHSHVSNHSEPVESNQWH